MNRLRTLLALFAFLGPSTAPEGHCAEATPELHAAWRAWQAGDLALAKKLAFTLAGQAHDDVALHLLTLTAIVRGEYAEARAAYRQIGPEYERLGELDEPMLWAHIHQGDLTAAREYAERRGLLRNSVTEGRLQLVIEHPLHAELSGVAELPFTDDKLTPFMPGFAVRLNGQATVARLDTGGAFLHLTPEQARTFGIKSVVCERSFFGLIEGGICYGMAETLEIGPVRLTNVPVAILDGLPGRTNRSQVRRRAGTNYRHEYPPAFSDDNRRAKGAAHSLATRRRPSARRASCAHRSGRESKT